MNNSPILIIGKNGKTGARVNQRLQAMGYQTRSVSRSTSPGFDWENQSTWRDTLQGVVSAYVTFQPDCMTAEALQTSYHALLGRSFDAIATARRDAIRRAVWSRHPRFEMEPAS